MDEFNFDTFIASSLKEDIGERDHTSLACISEEQTGHARIIVKESGIIAGLAVARQVFIHLNQAVDFHQMYDDGSFVENGDVIAEVHGNMRSILMGERLALNCMQHMSGIATSTRRLVMLVREYPVKILDTRKTIPGMRHLEKWAVRLGGGVNYRYGLFDRIIIKNNHIQCAGSAAKAIHSVKLYLQHNKLKLPVTVEVRNLDEVKEAMASEATDRIMLDNFSVDEVLKALAIIKTQKEIEVSGGITAENILSYAATGIDFISVGNITHSAKSLDISLHVTC